MIKSYWYGVGALTVLPLALGLSVTRVEAQVVPTAIDGTVVNQTGNQFGITGGQVSGDGTNLFHSFDRFGLSQGQVADFLANPQVRNIFGRVVGGEASAIDGLLKVSGGSANLFLMNPAGILFGPNARLDIPAAFTATTANGIGFGGGWFSASGVNDYGRLLGSPNALSFGLPQSGAIANFGQLAVGQGQSLSLVGGTVLNLGGLSAAGGNVTVAAVAGKQVARISPVGSLLSVEVPLMVGGQANEWKLPVGNLPQLLTGGGVGEANGVAVRPDGSIVLTASGKGVTAGSGDTIVAGKVDVSGRGVGGTATIVGDRVALVGATVEASGGAGGGNVRVGGEFQGKGAIPNAKSTSVSEDSRIRVNALGQGDGGRAIVWADRSTAFSGGVEARGAGQAGNGGFVEISGRENLFFNGKVDLAAPLGKSGQVLFDPRDINIVAGLGAQDAEVGDGQVFVADVGNPDFQIGSTTLQGINGDITLQASRDINLGTSLVFGNQLGRNIEFVAGGNFNGTGQNITAPGQNVSIKALGPVGIQVGQINTSIQTRGVNAARGGSINLIAPNGTIIAQSLLSQSQVCVGLTGDCTIPHGERNNGLSSSDGGDITVISFGDITTIGDIFSFSESFQGNTGKGGNVTLTSQRGAISVSSILAFSLADGEESGKGGAITIEGPKGITTTGDLDARSSSWATNSQAGSGGKVELKSSSGDIKVRNVAAESVVLNGGSANSGGLITINSGRDIATGALNSRSEVVGDGIAGTGGGITLNSSGNLTTTLLDAYSTTTNGIAGNGGTIALTSNNGKIETGDVKTVSQVTSGGTSSNGGSINITSKESVTTGGLIAFSATCNSTNSCSNPADSKSNNGGSISVVSQGDITTGGLLTWSTAPASTGNAGGIRLDSKNGNLVLDFADAYSLSLAGGASDGGEINLIAPGGNISSTRNIISFSNGISASGKGNNITIDAGKDITIPDTIASISTFSNGGDIKLTSRSGQINAKAIQSSAFAQGITPVKSGNIALVAEKGISVAKIDASSKGDQGKGGSVGIATKGLFRADGEPFIKPFFDEKGNKKGDLNTSPSCNGASICTAGGAGGGNIQIIYEGGSSITPFTIGAATQNGTRGGIKTNVDNVGLDRQVQSFKGGYRSPKGSIQINTVSSILLPAPPKSPISIENPDPSDIPRLFMDSLEERFTSEYEQFLGAKASKPMSVEQIQARLKEIDSEKNTQNVLVYFFFKGSSIEDGNKKELKDKEFSEKSNIWEWQTCRPGSKSKKCLPITKEQEETLLKMKKINKWVQEGKPSDREPIDSTLTEVDKKYLLQIKEREAGKFMAPYAEDTLGIALITAHRKILIPYIDRKTGCPLLYSDLLDKEVETFLRNTTLDGFDGKCLSLDQLDKSNWQNLAMGAVKRLDLMRSSENPSNNGVINDFIADLSPNKANRMPKPSQLLYKWLIQPFRGLIDKADYPKTHLSFMLDPTLGIFPIAALHNGRQFLIEEYSLSFMPSFSLIDSNIPRRLLKDSPMLAMGASDFPTDFGLNPLPLQLEVKTLKKIWCDNKQNPSKDKCEKQFFEKTSDFTVKKLKPSSRGDVPIVHLTTHGEFNSDNPKEAHIYIVRDPKKDLLASKFFMSEVRGLKLDLPPPPPIELLFLSACQTASSTPDAEFSFAGAAFQSRAKSIREHPTFAMSIITHRGLR